MGFRKYLKEQGFMDAIVPDDNDEGGDNVCGRTTIDGATFHSHTFEMNRHTGIGSTKDVHYVNNMVNNIDVPHTHTIEKFTVQHNDGSDQHSHKLIYS
jgi:hypothetical protein